MKTVVAKLAELEGKTPTYEDYKTVESLTPFFSADTKHDTITLLKLEEAVKDAILFHISNNTELSGSEIEQITAILNQSSSIDELELPKPSKQELKQLRTHKAQVSST